MRPAKSEVVNVELVDEIQVHEHAEGGLQMIIRIFPAASFSKKCHLGETVSNACCKFNIPSRIFGMFFILLFVCRRVSQTCVFCNVSTLMYFQNVGYGCTFFLTVTRATLICVFCKCNMSTPNVQNVWYGA